MSRNPYTFLGHPLVIRATFFRDTHEREVNEYEARYPHKRFVKVYRKFNGRPTVDFCEIAD